MPTRRTPLEVPLKPAPVEPAPRRAIDRPFTWGLVGALGVVATLVLVLAILNLSVLVFSIFMAAFITVGLDPLVRWLERRGMKRAIAILIVILAIIAIAVAIIWVVVPVVIEQLEHLITSLPAEIERLASEGWFILILTIYFIGTYDSTKAAAYRLVSRSHRETFMGYTEQIFQNVGRYLSGMVTLAFMNATFTTILLVATGIPGALLLGIIAFFITIIPLIGTVLTTIAMSIIAFIYDPTAGLIVLIFMLIYMQVEAYVFTPKVMSKAVKVPGSVVLISALAGGTLAGLPGSLVAIPVSAGILLILKGVVEPRKELS